MPAPSGNKFALGNTGGRPPKFDSEEILNTKISEYFDNCVPEYDEEKNIVRYNFPTVTGLALFLGFESRQSIYDYKDKNEFSYIIKRALLVIENHYEEKLNFQNSTGAIFALKNMDWKDKSEVDQNLKLPDISKEQAKAISNLLDDEC